MSGWEWTPTDMSDVPSLSGSGARMMSDHIPPERSKSDRLRAAARGVQSETRGVPDAIGESTGLGMPPTLTEFLLARLADDEGIWRQTYHPTNPMGVFLLADVAAKRAIVELHSGSHECSTYDHTGDIDNCTWCLDAEDCSTMRLLATIWADHPDWQEEWRV